MFYISIQTIQIYIRTILKNSRSFIFLYDLSGFTYLQPRLAISATVTGGDLHHPWNQELKVGIIWD